MLFSFLFSKLCIRNSAYLFSTIFLRGNEIIGCMKEAGHTKEIQKNQRHHRDESVLFNVAEMRSKLLVHPANILLVEVDEIDSRNKRAYIKNEERAYTLMNVSFTRLRQCAGNTIMVNKGTLIAIDIVHDLQHDIITLKNLFAGWNAKQVILNKKYKSDLYTRLHLKKFAA